MALLWALRSRVSPLLSAAPFAVVLVVVKMRSSASPSLAYNEMNVN
jgi:hypothetical protein